MSTKAAPSLKTTYVRESLVGDDGIEPPTYSV